MRQETHKILIVSNNPNVVGILVGIGNELGLSLTAVAYDAFREDALGRPPKAKVIWDATGDQVAANSDWTRANPTHFDIIFLVGRDYTYRHDDPFVSASSLYIRWPAPRLVMRRHLENFAQVARLEANELGNILVAEDDDVLAEMLGRNLEQEGYCVAVVSDGEAALQMAIDQQPDLLLLDWMMPKMSGIEVCRSLRQRPETQGLPIVMLTALCDSFHRQQGLSAGATDFLGKPFVMYELMRRIREALRCLEPDSSRYELRVGEVVLDRLRRLVLRNGREIRLSPNLFRLLEIFLSHPGEVMTFNQLVDAVWGADALVQAGVLSAQVARLRKALNGPGERELIRTVRFVGYAFD